MIQRKQSLWLFIAALLNTCIMFVDVYRTHTMTNGVDIVGQLRVMDHFPSLLLVLVMVLLPLVTIFMYKDRKRQIRMTAMAILSVSSFIALTLSRVTRLDKLMPPPTSGSYWIGAILPVISIVFLLLAIIGIRKDDKLVKSVDRLR